MNDSMPVTAFDGVKILRNGMRIIPRIQGHTQASFDAFPHRSIRHVLAEQFT